MKTFVMCYGHAYPHVMQYVNMYIYIYVNMLQYVRNGNISALYGISGIFRDVFG